MVLQFPTFPSHSRLSEVQSLSVSLGIFVGLAAIAEIFLYPSMASARKRRAAELDIDDDETEETHHQVDLQSEKEDEDCPVPELPPEIVVDIISRLPVKSVFICRRVCKLWLFLISGPDFAKLHLSRSQVSLLVKPLHSKRNPRKLQLIDLMVAPTTGTTYNARMILTPKTNLPRDPKIAVNFMNSCNGLLCLRDPKMGDPTYVCNPILGEYIVLPKSSSGANYYYSTLGFSPKDNQYKVARCFSQRVLNPFPYQYEVEIYTLGEGSWRSIGKSPYFVPRGAFLNGSVHCLTFPGIQTDFICCFDYVTEQFRGFPGPAQFTPLEKEFYDLMSIGVLQDCLSICNFTVSNHADIWLMKDYGVNESWSKYLVISNMIYETWHSDSYEPIIVFGSGHVLLLFNRNAILLYDPETEEYSKVRVHGIAKYFENIAHIPSFISLRDVAKGEDVKMCRG